MYKDGETYMLVIEWDTGEKPDPDDLEQPETCGAYEYAEAVAPEELVKADGLQLWHGWVWTKSGPTDRPARKVCPFSDYVSKFEL